MSKHLSPAYQLYSAREDASNDLEGVLDQLSRMGYEGVEFAGFFEKTAKEVRKLLKHAGLKAVSSHVPLQQIRDDMQSVLDYHEELECGCIAVPYLAEEDRPGQPGFARVLETLSAGGADVAVCMFEQLTESLEPMLARAQAFLCGIPVLLCSYGYALITDIGGKIRFASPKNPCVYDLEREQEYHLVETRRRGFYRSARKGL